VKKLYSESRKVYNLNRINKEEMKESFTHDGKNLVHNIAIAEDEYQDALRGLVEAINSLVETNAKLVNLLIKNN
jgi:phosphoenolpyruvate carboxylase